MNTAKPKANSNSTCYWSGEGEDVGGNMLETVDKWGVKGVEDKHAAYLSLREVGDPGTTLGSKEPNVISTVSTPVEGGRRAPPNGTTNRNPKDDSSSESSSSCSPISCEAQSSHRNTHALGKSGEGTGNNESGVGGMQSFLSNAVKGRRERRQQDRSMDIVVVTPTASKHIPDTPTSGGSRVFESCCTTNTDPCNYDIYPRVRGVSLSAYEGHDKDHGSSTAQDAGKKDRSLSESVMTAEFPTKRLFVPSLGRRHLDPISPIPSSSSESEESINNSGHTGRGIFVKQQWADMRCKDALAKTAVSKGGPNSGERETQKSDNRGRQTSQSTSTLEEKAMPPCKLNPRELSYCDLHLDPPPSRPPHMFHSPGGSNIISYLCSYEWMPDSSTESCVACARPFNLVQRRHHCRGCGDIFCGDCSNHRLLVQEPIAPREGKGMYTDAAIPQRVCNQCYAVLLPYQEEMIAVVAKAQRVTAGLNIDPRRPPHFLNSPFAYSLGHEIRKAVTSLTNLWSGSEESPLALRADQKVPLKLLTSAKGLIIVTAVRFGFIWSGVLGTGLCVVRLPDGTWSTPSAILLLGMGFGAQFGLEVTDYVIGIHSHSGVNMLRNDVHLALGGEVGVAVGLAGRNGSVMFSIVPHSQESEEGKGVEEEEVICKEGNNWECQSTSTDRSDQSKSDMMGDRQKPETAALSTSYGPRFIFSRPQVNEKFYGFPVKTSALLDGSVPQPPAAQPLYSCLDKLECIKITKRRPPGSP